MASSSNFMPTKEAQDWIDAIYEGNEKRVKSLIRKGANVNCIMSAERHVLLHFVMQFGHVRILQLLLEARANIEVKEEKEGWTPLHYAAQFSPACVELLIKRGANIHALTNNGLSSLYFATFLGQVASARLLLAQDPPVDHTYLDALLE
jgi:ankyrin repeat protein